MVGTRISSATGRRTYTINAVSDKTLTLDGAARRARHNVRSQGHGHARPHRRNELARQRLPRGPADPATLPNGTDFGCNDSNDRDGVLSLQDRADHGHRRDADGQDLADEHDARGARPYKPDALAGRRHRTLTVVSSGPPSPPSSAPKAGQPGADAARSPRRAALVPADRPSTRLGRPVLRARARPPEPAHVRQAAAPAERHPRPAGGRGRHHLRRPLACTRPSLLPGEGNVPPFRVAAAAARVAADRHAERLRRRQQGGPDRQPDVDGADRPEHGPGASTTRTCSATRTGTCNTVQRARQVPGRDQLRLDQHRRARTSSRPDGTLSTIEIVNIMLGAGNDHLTIAAARCSRAATSTRSPACAASSPTTAASPPSTAAATQPLKVDGTFTVSRGGAGQRRLARQPHAQRRSRVDALRLRRRPADHAAERPLLHGHRLRERASLRPGRHDAPRRRRPGRAGSRRPARSPSPTTSRSTGTFTSRPARPCRASPAPSTASALERPGVAEPRLRRRPEGLRARLGRADDRRLRERRRHERRRLRSTARSCSSTARALPAARSPAPSRSRAATA